MNTAQKDPGQFMLTGSRHDQAREHQVIFPGTMESDMKLVAASEIQLIEALKARAQQELDHVFNHLRMLVDPTLSAMHSPDVILRGDKSIL